MWTGIARELRARGWRVHMAQRLLTGTGIPGAARADWAAARRLPATGILRPGRERRTYASGPVPSLTKTPSGRLRYTREAFLAIFASTSCCKSTPVISARPSK
jgi:hypothetical protein